jgi:hypothetical protein
MFAIYLRNLAAIDTLSWLAAFRSLRHFCTMFLASHTQPQG